MVFESLVFNCNLELYSILVNLILPIEKQWIYALFMHALCTKESWVIEHARHII